MRPARAPVPRIPDAPRALRKGVPLKHLLGAATVDCLAHNVRLVYPEFDTERFRRSALEGLEALELMDRGRHLAGALRRCLPEDYSTAIDVLLASLTAPRESDDAFGLAEFFYLPHGCFVAAYGLDARNDRGKDPFEVSMLAQRALTMRFTAEFSIRPFLMRQQERTLARLLEWTTDPNPHVRRLCSEGARPRLPWGTRIPAFVADPSPALPILEALKDDRSLYVRRSVANHVGDIAKDHPDLAFGICRRWLDGASKEVKWLVRHALRHPAKKGDPTALALRRAAR